MRHGISLALATIFAAALTGGAAWAAGPSFDCAKAQSEAEKAICADPELSELDLALGGAYAGALAAAKGLDAGAAAAEKLLRAEQRGWIKGRDECWKSELGLQPCIRDATMRRTAELQAQWFLVEPFRTVAWTCNGNPADEVVTTFFPTDPGTARIERGDTTEIAVQGPSGSGARYEASFGKLLWIRGKEALLVWPEGTENQCVLRE